MPPRKSNISQATATDNDGGTPVKERDGTNIEVQYRSYPPIIRAIPKTPRYMGPLPRISPLPTPPTGTLGAIWVPFPPIHQTNAYGPPSYALPVIPPGSVLPIPHTLQTKTQEVSDMTATERMPVGRETINAISRKSPVNYIARAPVHARPNSRHPLPSCSRDSHYRTPEGALNGEASASSVLSNDAAARGLAKSGGNGHFQSPRPQAIHSQALSSKKAQYPTPTPQAAPYATSSLQADAPQAPVAQALAPNLPNAQVLSPPTQIPLQHRAMDPDADYRRKKDLSLPRTMVQRLAKGVLQPNTSISKDALLALSKGATVFINYLAQSANEVNLATNRKNIPPAAVFEGLSDIEFIDFIPRVEAELKRYNEVQTGKRNDYRRKVKEGKMGFGGRGGAGSGSGGDGDGDGDVEEGDERAAKRVRRDDDDATQSPESRRENGLGDPNQQLQQQMAEDEEDEDFDPPDDEEPEEDTRELRQRPEEEEEEGEEVEEEEDEDDEDAFPDEGMRLSSVERENYALDHPDDPVTPGSSADEEGSEEEESD